MVDIETPLLAGLTAITPAIMIIMTENACGPTTAASTLHRSATLHNLHVTEVATAVIALDATAKPV